MRAITICVAAGVLAVGCNSDWGPLSDERLYPWQERRDDLAWPPAEECDGFTAEFRVLDSMGQAETRFSRGEAIRFEMLITNGTTHDEILTVGMGPQVTIEVVDDEGRVVAGSALGVAFPAVVVHYPYGPGETSLTEWVWDQQRANGSRAPVGGYTVYADERSQCRDALSRQALIEIR